MSKRRSFDVVARLLDWCGVTGFLAFNDPPLIFDDVVVFAFATSYNYVVVIIIIKKV